ncbi:hypothetical protein D3C77_529310 [compost metagenome]
MSSGVAANRFAPSCVYKNFSFRVVYKISGHGKPALLRAWTENSSVWSGVHGLLLVGKCPININLARMPNVNGCYMNLLLIDDVSFNVLIL